MAEDGGRPAMSALRQADPFFPGGCRFMDPGCPIEGNKDCSQQSVLYKITCVGCKDPVDPNNHQEKEKQVAFKEGHEDLVTENQ